MKTKKQWIERKIEEFNYFCNKKDGDAPKIGTNTYIWTKEYVKSSLEEAWNEGRKEEAGLHKSSDENILI